MVLSTQYPYLLSTECGILYLYADGRWWQPAPRVETGYPHAPRGYMSPRDPGYVTLMKPDSLMYTARSGVRSVWVPGGPIRC